MFVQSAHIPEIIPVYARSPKGEPLEMVLVEWHKNLAALSVPNRWMDDITGSCMALWHNSAHG